MSALTLRLPVAPPPPSDPLGRWAVEPTADGPRAVRHQVLVAWDGDDVVERLALGRLALVLTELATNAVVHGGASIDLSLGSTDTGWLVTVVEHPPARPRAAQLAGRRPTGPDAADEGGRGLSIVAAVSTRCGWAPQADGLTVWCEVPRHVDPGAP